VQENGIPKSQLEARAPEFFRQVEASGASIVITDHGKPASQVRPYRNVARRRLDILRGIAVRYDDPFEPVGVEWDAAQ
jgi:antitoxin (DNA-binding transcriptional repressor) of toxin-antitoxin stability system